MYEIVSTVTGWRITTPAISLADAGVLLCARFGFKPQGYLEQSRLAQAKIMVQAPNGLFEFVIRKLGSKA